ncbi:FUSC family protein [Paracoccus sp. APAP_BH8]
MSADWLLRRGFDGGRLCFASRTALACCLAVLVAWAMGLEHPQWSGMSVWAAAQPLRGQLLEKAFFRFAGTLVGTGAGVLLVLGAPLHPGILVLGLALWVGLCTWAGNLQRGFIAYGTVLAGYSASMVALLDTAHPDRVLHLGADRLATVLTGVVVATLAGYFLAGQGGVADLRARIGGLLVDLLRHLAGTVPAEGRALLSRIAALEEGLDPHAAGSLRSRREVRASRAVLLAAMPLLLRAEGAAPVPVPLARRLADAAVALHRDWIGAREAGLRAGGAMLLFGLIWLATGWSLGPFMLLGLSVMISLFSTFENPAQMMRHVSAGQALGMVAAILCHWLLWPLARTELQQILMLVPLLMLAPLFGRTPPDHAGRHGLQHDPVADVAAASAAAGRLAGPAAEGAGGPGRAADGLGRLSAGLSGQPATPPAAPGADDAARSGRNRRQPGCAGAPPGLAGAAVSSCAAAGAAFRAAGRGARPGAGAKPCHSDPGPCRDALPRAAGRARHAGPDPTRGGAGPAAAGAHRPRRRPRRPQPRPAGAASGRRRGAGHPAGGPRFAACGAGRLTARRRRGLPPCQPASGLFRAVWGWTRS